MIGAVATDEKGDEEKLAELILYVADQIRTDPTGGATKLNKILYFAEFSHMRSYGVPITGVPYQKLPEGPAPRRLRPIRDKLIESGEAFLESDQYFGYPLARLIPKRAADVARFSGFEIKIVDQVVSALWGKTAREVSEMSHRETGWKMVEEGDDIPYVAAYLPQNIKVTDAMREHAAELAARRGHVV